MNRAVSSRCDGFTVFIIKEALFGVLHGDGVSPRKQTSNGAYELSTAINSLKRSLDVMTPVRAVVASGSNAAVSNRGTFDGVNRDDYF